MASTKLHELLGSEIAVAIEDELDALYLPRNVYVRDSKLRSLVLNIDPTSYVGNPHLRTKILDGTITPHSLVRMRPSELFPEHWKHLVDKIKRIDESKISGDHLLPINKHITCRRCGKNECTSMPVQTRSCDEGYTYIYCCQNCNNRWKHVT